MPTKVKFYLTIIAIIAVFVIYRINTTETALTKQIMGQPQATAVAAPPPAPAAHLPPPPQFESAILTSQNQWTAASELPEIAGCIYNARSCRCYAATGKALDLTLEQCMSAASEPLPFPINNTSQNYKKL